MAPPLPSPPRDLTEKADCALKGLLAGIGLKALLGRDLERSSATNSIAEFLFRVSSKNVCCD